MKQWSPRELLLTCLAGLSLCALLSVYKGQDTNWDLLNYHHYVAYAFLHGRLSVDLATAGMQSYINPSLDVPIFWLSEHLPGWQVGALIGAWHGLVFVLTLLIAREVWPTEQAGGSPLLIVCAGVLAPAFWGGLGNAMGDNAAAVLALGAAWTAIKGLKQLDGRTASSWVWFGATGFLLGACAALKLTNATVAVALSLAMLGSVRKPVLCLKLVACMLPCGMLGFALGGGWWFHQIWLQFGNPFFPQFGSIFPSKLAGSVSLADKRFVAESLGGLILRPVLMLFNSGITSEFFVLPMLWPFWFATGFLLLTRLMWRRGANGLTMGQSWRSEQQLVVVFLVLAVLFWAALFGIYRYTAAMEPLLPLCMVLLLSRAGCMTATIGAWLNRILVLSMLCTLFGGAVNWGHTGWAVQTYRAASPMLVRGDKPLVIVVGSGNSWLIPFLSAKASYTNVGGNFQFGQRFDAEVQRRALAADRVYALVGMSQNWRFDVVDKANEYLAALGALDQDTSCQWLSKAVLRTKPHAGFGRCEGQSCAHRCQLTRLDDDRAEVDRRDQVSLDESATALRPLGLQVSATRCTIESAYLGQKRYPFRLCELELTEPQLLKP